MINIVYHQRSYLIMNNCHLRTLEQILEEEQLGTTTVYAIAASPKWEHYDPHVFPRPLQEWVNKNCPEAPIERIANIIATDGSDETGQRYIEVPCPVFRVGFTDAQAAAFDKAWSEQHADSEDDIYFLTVRTQWPSPEPAGI